MRNNAVTRFELAGVARWCAVSPRAGAALHKEYI